MSGVPSEPSSVLLDRVRELAAWWVLHGGDRTILFTSAGEQVISILDGAVFEVPCPWCRECGSCDYGLPMSCTCGDCTCAKDCGHPDCKRGTSGDN